MLYNDGEIKNFVKQNLVVLLTWIYIHHVCAYILKRHLQHLFHKILVNLKGRVAVIVVQIQTLSNVDIY